MKKTFATILAVLLIFGMTSAFALNWADAETEKCEEYTLTATKYIRVEGDVGAHYEKAPNATAKVGDFVYFDLSALDAEGEEVDAEVEYHHLGNVEAVGKLYRAKVVGDKPWVKIGITEKTDVAELKYKNEAIVVDGNTVVIGDLVFTRNSDGVVTDVNSNLNVADMLAELAELGIDIQLLYDGKICMNDDILISNFGKVCKTEAVAAWYIEADVPTLGIPKTGDAVSIVAPTLVLASSLYIVFRKK